MKGFNVAEQAHVVLLGGPADINGAGLASERFSMRHYAHATILVLLGVTGAATTLKVQSHAAFTGGTPTDLPFAVYKEETAAGDTLGARTAVAATGLALSTNDWVFYSVEVDAEELTDGEPILGIDLSDPGAATFICAVAILSGAKYGGPETPTEIA